MARKPVLKDIENARLLKDYASWIYCTNCNKTVAYLCYVTYDNFDFNFHCNCGSKGKVKISFGKTDTQDDSKPLLKTQNRLCCPNDNSALLSIVDKNIKSYNFSIDCVSCSKKFKMKRD